MMFKEIIENIYTFYFPSSTGAMKDIKNFKIKYDEVDQNFFLTPIAEVGEAYKIERIQNPIQNGKKFSFIARGLFIPILLALTFLILGFYQLSIIKDEHRLFLMAVYSLVLFDILTSIYKLKSYESGMEAFLEKDFLKTSVIFIAIIGYGVFTIVNKKFDFLTLSSLFIAFSSYMFFIEGIKKPLLVMLSKNVQYWRYRTVHVPKGFIAISPKPIGV